MLIASLALAACGPIEYEAGQFEFETVLSKKEAVALFGERAGQLNFAPDHDYVVGPGPQRMRFSSPRALLYLSEKRTGCYTVDVLTTSRGGTSEASRVLLDLPALLERDGSFKSYRNGICP